jgi:hypothetical protein
MLFNLIEKRRGEETIVMTDVFKKVRNRMEQLRKSHRKGIKGDKVSYRICQSSETVKYKKKGKPGTDISGDSWQGPRRIKWN